MLDEKMPNFSKIVRVPLQAVSKQTINLPIGSKLLSASTYKDTLVLNCLIDAINQEEKETFDIELAETGQPMEPLQVNEQRIFLGSIHMEMNDIHFFHRIQFQVMEFKPESKDD